MTTWIILTSVVVVSTFGAVMYRAGRTYAENKYLRRKERRNEQVEQVLRYYNRLGRDELLKRLHDPSGK